MAQINPQKQARSQSSPLKESVGFGPSWEDNDAPGHVCAPVGVDGTRCRGGCCVWGKAAHKDMGIVCGVVLSLLGSVPEAQPRVLTIPWHHKLY